MRNWPFDHLTPFKYGVIYSDNPWPYKMRSAKGYAKSPEAHYRTMSEDELRALPVADLADKNCYLFMWSTWPHLKQAMALMEHWHFDYVTGGSWIKRTKNWKLCFGTGYVQRSATEPYLIGKIGRPSPASRSERNCIDAPLHFDDIPDKIEALRADEHSRKPIQMREMIERLVPDAPKCELFSREPWGDNDVWGNEAGKFEERHE